MKVANTKLGTDTKNVVKNIIIRSGHLLRFNAATIPKISPIIKAVMAAKAPILADTPKLVLIIYSHRDQILAKYQSRLYLNSLNNKEIVSRQVH